MVTTLGLGSGLPLPWPCCRSRGRERWLLVPPSGVLGCSHQPSRGLDNRGLLLLCWEWWDGLVCPTASKMQMWSERLVLRIASQEQQHPAVTQAIECKIFSLDRGTTHNRRAILLIAIGTFCLWTGSKCGLKTVEDPATGQCNYCVHLWMYPISSLSLFFLICFCKHSFSSLFTWIIATNRLDLPCNTSVVVLCICVHTTIFYFWYG